MNIITLKIKEILSKSKNYIGDSYVFTLSNKSLEKVKNIYDILSKNNNALNEFHIYLKIESIYDGAPDWGFISVYKDEISNNYWFEIFNESIELRILALEQNDKFLKNISNEIVQTIEICDILNDIESYIKSILENKEDYKESINAQYPYDIRKGYVDRSTFNEIFRPDISQFSYIINKNEDLAKIINDAQDVYYDRMDFDTYIKVYCECVRLIYKIDKSDEELWSHNFAHNDIDMNLMNNEHYFAIKYNELISNKFTHIIYNGICLWADYENGKWKLTLDIRKPYYMNHGINTYVKIKDKICLSKKYMFVNALLHNDKIVIGNHEKLLMYDENDNEKLSMIVPIYLIEKDDILTDEIKNKINWYDIEWLNDIN